MSKNDYLMHFFHAIGARLSEADAKAYLINLVEHGCITEREGRVAMQTMLQSSLERCPSALRDEVRADMMRHILMLLMME
jgi:transcriptional regulator CtsR